ncbi:hypothetical protein PDUR_18015 [Paenibacillus durus]|uniref:Uncharacterized protein n=1 Tax=Paenibacillus durus TaxID=44251 RepID=A0A089HNN5_PAEDU|nr:hypothetical protein PDUR_18015 [Paenibacillus durus]
MLGYLKIHVMINVIAILYKLINRVWAFLQATLIATGYKRKQSQEFAFSGKRCLRPGKGVSAAPFCSCGYLLIRLDYPKNEKLDVKRGHTQ